MSTTYCYNKDNEYWIITFNNINIKLDNLQLEKILNFNKKFIHILESNTYPSYSYNNKEITIFEFLYNINPFKFKILFKNNDIFDLREENVSYTTNSFYDKTCDLKNINYLKSGILIKAGKYSGELKNSLCTYYDESLNKTIYLMELNNNKYCKLCEKSLEIISNYNKKHHVQIIWTVASNNYILGNNNKYIHQIICECYGNGKGTKNISVDHINNDTLDNRFDNLRIATQKVQILNTTGVKEGTQKQRFSKKKLPEGLTENMMKKYVYFNEEFYDKEKTKKRMFFRVEHPKLSKPWVSSKSNSISIFDKLNEANKVAENIENDIVPDKKENKLPKYVRIGNRKDKKILIYERRIDGKRENSNMVLNKYDENDEKCVEILNDYLKQFGDKIKSKFNYDILNQ